MARNTLHIVSFDVPFPPNYGGVIDVFYKIRWLQKKGVDVVLHCYEYPGRSRAEELNHYCLRVEYYPRLLGLSSAFSFKPYIVQSRRSEQLINNLLKDSHPILFEGLHSCYYIDDKRLKDRIKIYRESNIEHRYYFNLFKVEPKFWNKIYFLKASSKLYLFQGKLRHSDMMFAVSSDDAAYLRNKFPRNKVEFIPSFHGNDEVTIMTGTGDYVLYHGNIEVPENFHAVKYLIKNVFSSLDVPFVIAGMNPTPEVMKMAEGYPHIRVIPNPTEKELDGLIQNAQINLLTTFQATGLKLKLLNTLYKGRHCLVNEPMLNGTGLHELCEIADTPDEMKDKIRELMVQPFLLSSVEHRSKVLSENYSNDNNITRLIGHIFG